MPSVLPGVFNPDMAVLFQERLITHGVEVRLGEGLRVIYGDPVKGVRMDRGDTACDAVVRAMGRRPNIDFMDLAHRGRDADGRPGSTSYLPEHRLEAAVRVRLLSCQMFHPVRVANPNR